MKLGELMASDKKSVDPRKFPNDEFELFSIPAYDEGKPERVFGSEIGSSKQILQPNDVLISRIVPHIRRSWVVPESNGLLQIGSSEWIIFRANNFYPEYLRHYLLSDQFNAQFMSTVAGVGGSLLRARPAAVAKLEITLPEINEQRRIAAILDKADEIGKNSEDTKLLQERIAESLFIELFGDPILNQRDFPLTTLSDECEVISGFAFKSAEYSENPSHINLVRGQNISHGFLDWKLGKYWKKMEDSWEKYQLFEGDVVLAMDRPIISTGLKISEITTEDIPALLVQRVARIRSSKLPSCFILALLKHPIFIRTIESSKTETTIPHITLRDVKELQFPLPPPELLEQYSKTLYLYKQITLHSSERISSSRNVKQSLTQEMLT